MGILLKVDGYFNISIKYLDGKYVGEHKDADILQGILDNLKMGEYVIGMASQCIYDINDMSTPIYEFELDATDSVEYDFDEE